MYGDNDDGDDDGDDDGGNDELGPWPGMPTLLRATPPPPQPERFTTKHPGEGVPLQPHMRV